MRDVQELPTRRDGEIDARPGQRGADRHRAVPDGHQPRLPGVEVALRDGGEHGAVNQHLQPKHWSGIEATLPLTAVDPGDPKHPGAEGLVLAHVDLAGTSVPVACSVLPWRGAGSYRRGLPDGQFEQFRCVLDEHVARITAARWSRESLIWGGDLNQELTPPLWAGTNEGTATLRAAFEYLGLTSLTRGLAHLKGQPHAIDHLAVSADLLVERVEVHRPTWPGGRDLSDHAAYTADVELTRT